MTSLAHRTATKADRAFVVDSFISSYRTAHTAGLISMADWRQIMAVQIVGLLDRPGVDTIVAYRPGEDPGTADIYGWIAVEARREHGDEGHPIYLDCPACHDLDIRPQEPMVVYVYVKAPYRKLGIARGLLKAAGIEPGDPFDYAAKTAVVSKLRHKIPAARWNPLRARFAPKTRPPTEKTECPKQSSARPASKSDRPA